MIASTQGFTLVEIVITATLASFLAIALTQAVFGASAQQEAIERYSTADEIAQKNLRKYYSASDTGVSCPTTNPSSATAILGSNGEPAPVGNYKIFTQSVTISWPYGCSRAPLLESSVSFSATTSPEVITHAKYAH